MVALEPVFGGGGAALAKAAEAAQALVALFEGALDRPAGGLLERFARTRGSERRRAIASSIFIFGAGFATTIHAIGNGVLALVRNPEQGDRLRAEPALLPSAAEEILRYDPPIQRVQRFALERLEIGGHPIPRGAVVVPVLGSANRDPAEFAAPERFDVGRDARGQLAFGGGIHHCLGAWLARLELRCAFGALLESLPRLVLADEFLEWRETAARGLRRLELRR